MAIYRSDQALVVVNFFTVVIDNEPWDLFDNGEDLKTAGLKVYPGGMKDAVELGGTPEPEPIKVARKWCDPLIAAYKPLRALVGNGPAEVSITTKNAARQNIGETDTYTGIVLGVKRATYKAGPSEEIMLEVTIGPHGGVA
jgi:hypothetical protein